MLINAYQKWKKEEDGNNIKTQNQRKNAFNIIKRFKKSLSVFVVNNNKKGKWKRKRFTYNSRFISDLPYFIAIFKRNLSKKKKANKIN